MDEFPAPDTYAGEALTAPHGSPIFYGTVVQNLPISEDAVRERGGDYIGALMMDPITYAWFFDESDTKQEHGMLPLFLDILSEGALRVGYCRPTRRAS
jgi:hypothetical protein